MTKISPRMGRTERFPLDCVALATLGLTTADCCSSCHSEWDDEVYFSYPRQLKDGRWIETCCTKTRDLEERGLL